MKWNRAWLACVFCVSLPAVQDSEPAVLAPLVPAEGLHSVLDMRGVYLIWRSRIDERSPLLKFDYRVYRTEKGSSRRVSIPYKRAITHTRQGERWAAVDTGIEWEKAYSYSVMPLTRVYSEDGKLLREIEGNSSAPIEVTTHNVFPPAMPEELQAAPGRDRPGKNFVDLIWAPNREKDIVRYNIYRREEGGRMALIKSVPPDTLSFQDLDVVPEHTYFYSVSAIDGRGNESDRARETTAVKL